MRCGRELRRAGSGATLPGFQPLCDRGHVSSPVHASVCLLVQCRQRQYLLVQLVPGLHELLQVG